MGPRSCNLCGRELLKTETLQIHLGERHPAVVRKIDLGPAQNLIALLESSKPTRRIFLPTAEELDYETPAMDLLSSFGK